MNKKIFFIIKFLAVVVFAFTINNSTAYAAENQQCFDVTQINKLVNGQALNTCISSGKTSETCKKRIDSVITESGQLNYSEDKLFNVAKEAINTYDNRRCNQDQTSMQIPDEKCISFIDKNCAYYSKEANKILLDFWNDPKNSTGNSDAKAPVETVPPQDVIIPAELLTATGNKIDFDEVSIFANYIFTKLAVCDQNCSSKFNDKEKARLTFIVNMHINGNFIVENISRLIPSNFGGTMPIIQGGYCNWKTLPMPTLEFLVEKIVNNPTAFTYCRETIIQNPRLIANKIISTCQNVNTTETTMPNKPNCQSIISSLKGNGNLPYTTPSILSTLYWNMHSNIYHPNEPARMGHESYLKWIPLTEEERSSYLINYIANRDAANDKISEYLRNNGYTGKNKLCNVRGGMGWLLCSGSGMVGEIADTQFGLLEHAMAVPTSFFTQKDKNNVEILRNTTDKFKNVANIFLIIVFLIMAISYMTGYGLSNYSIKTMFPKLVVSAILINISFYVVQLSVDISNIIGKSIYNILINITNESIINADLYKIFTWTEQVESLQNLAKAVLNILLIIVAGAIAIIGYFIQILILNIRNVIIIILIVTAPLAIASMMLNGTQKFFKMWWNSLLSVLMIYPLVSLLYGIGMLSSNLLFSSNDITIHNFIVGKLLAIIPMFLSPYLIIKMISQVSVVGQKVGSILSKGVALAAPASVLKNYRKTKTGQAYAALRKQKIDAAFAGNYNGKNIFYTLLNNVSNPTAKYNADQTTTINKDRMKTMNQASQSISLSEAQKILEGGNPNRQTISVVNNFAMDKDKKMIALKAYFEKSVQDNSFESTKLFEYINTVKESGASQNELYTIFQDFKSQVKNSNRYDIAGELDAYQKFYNNNFGVYSTLDNVSQRMKDLKEEEMSKAFDTMIINSPTEFAQINLESFKNEIGKKVLLDKYHSNPDTRKFIEDSISMSDANTQKEFDLIRPKRP